MKPYSKFEDVLKSIRRYVNYRRLEGNYLLKGERELAELFGTSRKTLAKVLTTLEAEKLIFRNERKATRIAPLHPQKFKYAFVSNYHRETGFFWYPNEKRVFQNLKILCADNLLKVDAVPFDPENPDDNTEKLAVRLSGYSIVFCGLLRKEDFSKLSKYLKSAKTEIIPTDERFLDDYSDISLIALDYYESGKIAAKAFLEHGYSHPYLVGHVSFTNSLICRRIKGFTDVMERHGIPCGTMFSDYQERLEGVIRISEFMKKITSDNVDSLFFPLDRYMDLMLIPLYRRNLVPEIGIIASLSAGEAAMHVPTVFYLTNGEKEIAETIMGIILRKESGTWNGEREIFRISSCLVEGQSLK